FTSYFFTWKEDQDKVLNNDSSFLLEDDTRAANLLGRLGAYISHFFIYRGFGIASMLFCTFFFVVGINLLTNRKVFSIWRNLKYVTIGLLLISVTLGFLFANAAFPFGGRVGDMISNWLDSFLGTIGTAALLIVVGISYLIWQFNPSFNLPERNLADEIPANTNDPQFEMPENVPVPAAKPSISINDKYADADDDGVKTTVQDKTNQLKGEGGMIINENGNLEEDGPVFEIIERDEPKDEEEEELSELSQPAIEKELVGDIMHEHDVHMPLEMEPDEKPEPAKKNEVPNLQLEIKKIEEEPVDDNEEAKGYSDLPPYEPTLDLRDYKYPKTDLLETHGSEKIIQDPAELEANKNQIINTLKNYDISIQKISATVGPTVTLYEIVPAAGVRISRIKNLEDDIALSLAALGIRIIAPIPGKGTIGIEVPNHKKSVVSMKALLSSEKFTHNSFSLPIAIGKKIDNENFIVDLASMPHLLMAGATGQGKSVGLNAILVSLLYKKHPSQLKFVMIDPKKVELSVYRHIEKHFLAKLPGEEDAIITDTKKVINTLNALCIEMDNRYDLLKEAGARNIKEYNEKFTKRRLNPQKGHQYLPFIVLVIDEFADLIMTAGKEVEMPIARLAQLARAVGIHLIIATQRPSVNIITGTIKANFPARIAFKVSSKIDSRTILDAGGAEQLIG
ncbi:MAG TPA: DNA translocase FtsK 4TM domain-containing protein, partial [Flavisolibacter sp.]|nr:DNA translocase FtsK 4TM domain-containing protein [Flavisolibacter sp.]